MLGDLDRYLYCSGQGPTIKLSIYSVIYKYIWTLDSTNYFDRNIHCINNLFQGCSYKDVLRNSPFKCDKCSAVFMLEMFYQIHREKHMLGNLPDNSHEDPDSTTDRGQHKTVHTLLHPDGSLTSKKKKKYKKPPQSQYKTNANGEKVKRKRSKPQLSVRRLPLFCMRCQFYASKVDELVSHMYLHGPTKGELTCGNCDYISNNRGNFRRHVLTHGNIRPHKCPYCPFAASQKTHLTRHVSYHIGDRAFKCEQCSYSCSDKANQNRHKKIHLESDAPTMR